MSTPNNRVANAPRQAQSARRARATHTTNLLWLCVCAALVACGAQALASGIRIVTYNIECSGLGIVAPNTGFDTVIQAIGNHHFAGNAQQVDVLVLQELDGVQPAPQGNSATLPYIVNQLNAIYGSGTYAFDPTADPTNGPFVGNGPNGLVYNTHTIQVVTAAPIGAPPSSSGAPRQPIRYKLHPIGYSSAGDFYIYVSHYKASSGSSNMNRRNIEAAEIRADADALGAAAHVIYAGDFNFTGGTSEPAFQTLISAGNGQAHDPASPANNWANTPTYVGLCTESATTLDIRFDFLMVSGAVLNQPGLQVITSSYAAFGNNGSTAFGGNVGAAGNTDLADLTNRTQVLHLLTTVSDHLPVVADFSIVGLAPPPPTSAGASPNPVCDGGPTTLSATVPAGQTVDWFTGSCGGTPVGTGTSLVVTPAAGTTYFARARVVASGELSTSCASVPVSVAQSPGISQQPAPMAVCPSGSAAFAVTAGGTGPLAYQWRKDAVPLANNAHFSGVNTASLSVSSATEADGGEYDCVVTNPCGSATSDAATLSVCPADYDCNGFMNGDDFDQFVSDFELGLPVADVDHNSFVNGDDFDFFVEHFEIGC